MKLTIERAKALASYCTESEVIPSFGLKDEDNVKTACVDIAKFGIPVDMECFMGHYYFNFKTKKQHDAAWKIVSKKIDMSKEDQLDGKTKKAAK